MLDQHRQIGEQFVIPRHIVWQDVAGDLVLFNRDNESYHALNEIASSIWRSIAQSQPLAAIIDALGVEYHADAAMIACDVRQFVQEALQHGLLIAVMGDAA